MWLLPPSTVFFALSEHFCSPTNVDGTSLSKEIVSLQQLLSVGVVGSVGKGFLWWDCKAWKLWRWECIALLHCIDFHSGYFGIGLGDYFLYFFTFTSKQLMLFMNLSRILQNFQMGIKEICCRNTSKMFFSFFFPVLKETWVVLVFQSEKNIFCLVYT